MLANCWRFPLFLLRALEQIHLSSTTIIYLMSPEKETQALLPEAQAAANLPALSSSELQLLATQGGGAHKVPFRVQLVQSLHPNGIKYKNLIKFVSTNLL